MLACSVISIGGWNRSESIDARLVNLDQSELLTKQLMGWRTYTVAQDGDLEAREQLLGGPEGEISGHFVYGEEKGGESRTRRDVVG